MSRGIFSLFFIVVLSLLVAGLWLALVPEPALAANYTVTNTNDSGAGSLRQAIIDANTNPGADTIDFNITGGPNTISPTSPLPNITDQVTIDGYTEPGAATANGGAATIMIRLNGFSAGAGADGLYFTAGSDNSQVRGLAITLFDDYGIAVDGATGVTVDGCYIGTDETGTIDRGNGMGIYVTNGANNCTIGGTAASALNLISGNSQYGIYITGSTGTTIQGSFIGTDINGTALLSNDSNGINLENGADNTVIGGTAAGAGNLVSENGASGIRITNSTACTIQGNFIGTDISGTASLPNTFSGVVLQAGADGNTVGGSAAGAGNLISGNGGDGISINAADGNTVEGNLIGTDAAGTAAVANGDDGITVIATSTGNTIGGDTAEQRNVISGNTRSGISIDGATGNTALRNFIGLNAAGSGAVPNGRRGVALTNNANSNTIGGGGFDGNIISGNTQDGVYVSNASNNDIIGNFIGTDSSGSASVPNQSSGILLQFSANNNFIGGTGAGEGNLISGNASAGVRIYDSSGNTLHGNGIGTDETGTAALGNMYGVYLSDGSTNNTIGGSNTGEGNLVSGNTFHGIIIDSSNGNTAAGNLIGTDATGSADLGNGAYGVYIGSAADNTVGGTTTGHRNVISGNDWAGVCVSNSTGTTVSANYIGIDAAGTTAMANSDTGVSLTGGSTASTVGGTTAGERNVISGNGDNGIYIDSSTANSVEGNYIGVDAGAGGSIPNALNGVEITSGADSNTVGGSQPGSNLIGFNGQDGVGITSSTDNVVSHNQITDNTGIGVVVWNAAAIRNEISENSIYGNGELGIDLGGDGVTPNDGDNNNPAKPNRGYNFPEFSAAQYPLSGGDVTVSGTAPPNAMVELYYVGTAPDPSGHGEGQTYLDSTTADGSGDFSATLSGLAGGDELSAIAISPAGDPSGEGNTSEFSENVTVIQTYTINAVVSGTGGAVDPTSQTVFEGDDASIDITPDAGYHIESITDNGAPAAAADPYIIQNVQEDHDVVVTFASDVQPSVFYFAEGYTGAGFQEFLCLANPGDTGTFATITYMFPDGTAQEQEVELGAGSRLTVNVNDEVGPDREVSAVVGCDQPIVAERPMYFSYQGKWAGGHDVIGATSTSGTWYFAEGYTGEGFDEWICVLNPGDKMADLTFRFQTQEEGEKVVTGFAVPAHSRASFKANDLLGGAYQTSLALESTAPVVAERPMYFSYSGTGDWGWTGGHCVMGAPSLANQFYFAEGTTRGGFEEWLTIQNPGAVPIDVKATYMLGTGQTVDRTYGVPAGERSTVYVPTEVGADHDVSVYLFSTSPFLAERPMYFSYGGMMDWGWTGGHCVIGATASSTAWYFAEGYTGPGFEEWLCIQNPGTSDAVVTINYYPEEGAAPITRVHEVAAESRFTVPVNVDAGTGLTISAEVTSTHPVTCERPMYFDYNGTWPGGHTVVGFTP